MRRKWLVTALYECERCGLRFRVPKDGQRDPRRFYDGDYEQGFTTTLPAAAELDRLLGNGFAGHEKDYRPYLDVMAAAGVVPPATVLDFGASWGYGSWQLRRAGYEVFAYEISERRRRFAAARLGMSTLDDPAAPPVPLDCFFSAHVMEHLGNPNDLWMAAVSALKLGGVFIAFMPNGDPGRESTHADYHRQWGQVHPLLITPKYLMAAATHYGLEARIYSSPYPLDRIRARAAAPTLLGPELAIVAWRCLA